MIDKLYFFYCFLLTFSGFVIAFYGIMARHQIELETRNGLNKGYDFESIDGNAYFAQKFKNWQAGEYFHSQMAPLIGISIIIIGVGLNLICNTWWTSILLLFLSYNFYLYSVKLVKWRIQTTSILTLLISIILIILKLN